MDDEGGDEGGDESEGAADEGEWCWFAVGWGGCGASCGERIEKCDEPYDAGEDWGVGSACCADEHPGGDEGGGEGDGAGEGPGCCGCDVMAGWCGAEEGGDEEGVEACVEAIVGAKADADERESCGAGMDGCPARWW